MVGTRGLADSDNTTIDVEMSENEVHCAMDGEEEICEHDDVTLIQDGEPSATSTIDQAAPSKGTVPLTLSDDLLAQVKLQQWGRVLTLLDDPSTDVNKKDPATGGTALHRAAYFGNVRTVERLLELGAERHARDAVHLSTPLHCAAVRGHYEVCRKLVHLPGRWFDADIDLVTMRDRKGRTAGDRANCKLHDKLASMLFHLEAGFNLETGQGKKTAPPQPTCMPRNAARTVVCLEKWIVVILFTMLTGASVAVLVYSVGTRDDCDDGKADSDSNMCKEYWTGIIASAICAAIFFILSVFFLWLFFFGPLRMKEPKKTK